MLFKLVAIIIYLLSFTSIHIFLFKMVNVIGVLVAFIPTGLPVAVTLSLLLMARKMAKVRVLVKNLTVIETLSCVNVIASDKTGTLTQNKMFVGSAAAGMHKIDLGHSSSSAEAASGSSGSAFRQLAIVAKLCNNAHFVEDSTSLSGAAAQPALREANGDATDIALLRSQYRAQKKQLQEAMVERGASARSMRLALHQMASTVCCILNRASFENSERPRKIICRNPVAVSNSSHPFSQMSKN